MKSIRKIVLPGEKLGERRGKKLGENVYVENKFVFSKVIGIPVVKENEIDVIPLAGVYIPKVGDKVIGIVTSIEFSGWFVDINSPYTAFLPLAEAVKEFVDVYRVDLSRYYDIGDVIYCRVIKVGKDKTVQLSMKYLDNRKLSNGVLVRITPYKIPRVIGRGGSMINLIKEKTNCSICVGQNGIVWIRGRNKAKAIQAILMVEKESHTIGLTQKIERLLGGRHGRKG